MHNPYGPDYIGVKLQKWTYLPAGSPFPDWLGPRGLEPNYLLLVRCLPNGTYELRASTPSDRTEFKCECRTEDDLVAAMERQMAGL